MPSNWEEMYRAGDTPWEKGEPHPALVDFLKRTPVRGRVLVPGCGAGHEVRALAASADEVVGIDIAPSAIARARSYPIVGGERYELADFFHLSKAMTGSFDALFEHTCFCAIDPSVRASYVRSTVGALKKGGLLIGIFFLTPEPEDGHEGPPFGVSLPELDDFFLPHFTLVSEWAPPATYPGREGREWCRVLRVR